MFLTIEINEKTLQKEKLFVELESTNSKTKKLIESALKDGSIVYGAKKGGVLKAVYILSRKDVNNKKIAKLEKTIISSEIDDTLLKDFDEIVKDEMKEKVIFDEEFNEVEWKDEIMAPRKVKIDKYDLTLGVLLLFIGLFIMILVKDFWYLGLILILLSTTTGVKVIPKKKNKSKKK